MFRIFKLLILLILFFIVVKFPFVPTRNKSKIVLKLIKMGGVAFVKMGQSMAVRSDIVGEYYASELKSLQDNMKSFSYNKFHSIVKKNLEKPTSEVFKEIDKKPIGCASIAQVHKGILLNGDKVAIKVLRPNIRKTFFKDIKLFYKLAIIIEFINPKFKRLRFFDVVSEMHRWVNSELSLYKESNNARKLYNNFHKVDKYQGDFFKVPKIYDEYSTDDIMVIEWVDGIRIDDINSYEKNGLKGKDILQKSATVFFLQVFRDGFFHADMHPGNMFIDKEANLRPIDFGIMGILDKKTRIFIADILYYLMEQDYRAVSDVHFKAGYIPTTYGIDEFAVEIEKIDKSVRSKGNIADISMGDLLGQLFATTERFQMRTRPELLLLQKTIIVAEGVGRIIAPKENMWDLIADLIEEWFKVNRGLWAKVEDVLSSELKHNNVSSRNVEIELMDKSSIKKSIFFDIFMLFILISIIFYVI